MNYAITWDFIAVWTLFLIAVVFILKPLFHSAKKKKNCKKCHP
jgi:hypothetical protein